MLFVLCLCCCAPIALINTVQFSSHNECHWHEFVTTDSWRPLWLLSLSVWYVACSLFRKRASVKQDLLHLVVQRFAMTSKLMTERCDFDVMARYLLFFHVLMFVQASQTYILKNNRSRPTLKYIITNVVYLFVLYQNCDMSSANQSQRNIKT